MPRAVCQCGSEIRLRKQFRYSLCHVVFITWSCKKSIFGMLNYLGNPPVSVATIGAPIAIASITTFPNVSYLEGIIVA